MPGKEEFDLSVATCHNAFTESEDFSNETETKANAKLIASALDLLEALQSIELRLAFAYEYNSDLPNKIEVMKELKIAKQAINKALN